MVILGFIFLGVLQAAVSQIVTPRGPRPVPGRGDDPGPTPWPFEPTDPPESCEGEFTLFILLKCKMTLQLLLCIKFDFY